MIQRVTGGLLVIVACVALAACGRKEASRPAGLEAVDPSGQTVTFWYQHTKQREAVLQQLIGRFNRSNAYGIKVVGEHAGTYDEIYGKMLVRVQSGALPELVVAYPYQARAYYRNHASVDLRPYMNSPHWGLSADERADYFQEYLEQDQMDGAQIAFLPSRSMEVLYYNVDWLHELGEQGPPRDWKTFARLCRAAAAHPFSKYQGKGHSTGLAFSADASRLAAMVFSRGGSLISSDQSAYTLDTPQMRASLEMLRALCAENAAELLDDPPAVRHAFSDGRALFVMRSSSGLPLYRSDVEAGAHFTWDVGPVPYEGSLPIPDVYGASLAVCRTTPQKQLAAWLFIKWFTEPPQQTEWSHTTGYFPVRRSAARDVASYFRIPYGLLSLGKPEPRVIGYGAVRQMIEDCLVRVVQGADLEQSLTDLEKQANRTLKP